MKFIHISDLHLGKRVNEFSMLEEQKYILQQVLDTVQNEAVDAVLIAGDIYDKPVPPAEAVVLFDTFLTTSFADEKGSFYHQRQSRQRRAALIWKQSVYGGGDSYCAGI